MTFRTMRLAAYLALVSGSTSHNALAFAPSPRVGNVQQRQLVQTSALKNDVDGGAADVLRKASGGAAAFFTGLGIMAQLAFADPSSFAPIESSTAVGKVTSSAVSSDVLLSVGAPSFGGGGSFETLDFSLPSYNEAVGGSSDVAPKKDVSDLFKSSESAEDKAAKEEAKRAEAEAKEAKKQAEAEAKAAKEAEKEARKAAEKEKQRQAVERQKAAKEAEKEAGDSGFKIPDVKLPDVSSIALPKVDIPKVEIPKIDIPKVEAPKKEAPSAPAVFAPAVDFKAPELPDIKIPDIKVPDIKIPDVKLPSFSMPKIDIPNVDIPKIDAPKFDMPKVDMPKVDAPKFDMPKVDVPPPPSFNVPSGSSESSGVSDLEPQEVRDARAAAKNTVLKDAKKELKEAEKIANIAREKVQAAKKDFKEAKGEACATRPGGKLLCLRGFGVGY